ncbi:MAG: hypothetical protein ACW98U_04765 [Candidatus Thorarchaeota archaeon]
MSTEVEPKKAIAIRAYGVSGNTLKKEIETITGVNPGSNAVYTEETGRVAVASEMLGTGGCGGGGDCYGCDGGGGGGEGAIVCLIIVVAIMAALTIVWAVVMIAFSIMTLGGFFRKRFRTLFVIEIENKEFIGKLAAITVQKRGVLEYPFEHREYDEWMTQTFRKFNRLKYLRQISIFFGFWWGFFEIAFKLNQLLLNPADYNLWPLRYVMIAIFLPLLLYSPILEIQFRGVFHTGDEMVMRLISHEPSYSPNQPMMFLTTPIEVGKITESETKKHDYENSS